MLVKPKFMDLIWVPIENMKSDLPSPCLKDQVTRRPFLKHLCGESLLGVELMEASQKPCIDKYV